jgi:hypothetical protein
LGKVICINGRARLATDRLGHDFPWRVAAPHHRPAVNFDLPAQARHRGLPPPPTQLHPAPTGTPPRCFTPPPATLPDPTAAATTGGAATQPADGLDRMADVHRRARRRRASGSGSPGDDRRPAPATHPLARPPPKPNRGPIPLSSGQGVNSRKPENIPQGKHTSLMQPQPLAGVHLFSPTLQEWEHGIPVDCSPDWEWGVIEAAVARGPHPTARTPESVALFQDDI